MSIFFKHDRVYSNPGNGVVDTYRSVVDKVSGVIELKKSGKYDLYAYIQSHASSVDINTILDRFAAGDTSVLFRREPLFFDATEFPDSYAAMYQKIIDAQAYFERLPVEVRDKFGHSPETFFATLGQDKWFEYMSSVLEPADIPDMQDKMLEQLTAIAKAVSPIETKNEGVVVNESKSE